MLVAATQAYSQSTSASCDGATGSSHASAPPVDTNQIWQGEDARLWRRFIDIIILLA